MDVITIEIGVIVNWLITSCRKYQALSDESASWRPRKASAIAPV